MWSDSNIYNGNLGSDIVNMANMGKSINSTQYSTTLRI